MNIYDREVECWTGSQMKSCKSFTVWKTEFDHLLLSYSSKNLRMFDIIIKIIQFSLKWYFILAMISYYMEVQCINRWDKSQSDGCENCDCSYINACRKSTVIRNLIHWTIGVILKLNKSRPSDRVNRVKKRHTLCTLLKAHIWRKE